MIPPSIHRKTVTFNLCQRLLSYSTHSQVGKSLEEDVKLNKAISWVHSLPKDIDPEMTLAQYKRTIRNEYTDDLEAQLRCHENFRDLRPDANVKARYLLEWSQASGTRPFWKEDLSFDHVSLLWRFRATCMALAHNAPYRYNGNRVCRLCDKQCPESEQHVLFGCEATRPYREEISEQQRWLRTRRFETLSQQLARIGKSRDHAALARYIYKVLKHRKILLDRKDRVARILL